MDGCRGDDDKMGVNTDNIVHSSTYPQIIVITFIIRKSSHNSIKLNETHYMGSSLPCNMTDQYLRRLNRSVNDRCGKKNV